MNLINNKLLSVEQSELCFTRRKYGRGFQYFNEDGNRIEDKKTINRIRKLVIPPMWESVKICRNPKGYLQATGRDLKHRKQYIYHQDWEKKRQAKKFAKLKKFGKRLPSFREYCIEMVKQSGWPREKVLSLIVLVLDETGIRIGNQQYANRNGTYGLSTLRRKHLKIEGQELKFHYQGKSKQEREVTIKDRDLIHFIKQSAEQPGYEIFRYYDENRNWQSVDSDELNAFIQEHLGKKFSSKDFRTWVASRLAVECYPHALQKIAENPRRRLSPTLVRLVANELGNTPTVCRNYYLHPKILQAVAKQKLPTMQKYFADVYEQHAAAEEIVLTTIS
jgi:DNA topoisomerase-1